MLAALIAIPIIAYLAILVWLYVNQRQLLYFPDPTRPRLLELAQLGVREVGLTTADGLSLLSWYLPPQAGRPVILYFHGNGGNIRYRADRVLRFARDRMGALMVEYRGYGGNPGSPSETGFIADAEAAVAFLDQERIARNRVVLYGESLGSGVAVQIAARQRVAALVLESPYTSIAAAAQYHYPYIPAALLVRDRFDSLARIGSITAPVLIMHGEADGIVPVRFGKALLAAAQEPKEGWFVPQAGHEDLAAFGGLEVAAGFIDRHVGTASESTR